MHTCGGFQPTQTRWFWMHGADRVKNYKYLVDFFPPKEKAKEYLPTVNCRVIAYNQTLIWMYVIKKINVMILRTHSSYVKQCTLVLKNAL